MTRRIDNLILNPPYEQPDRYFEIGSQGPTGQIKVVAAFGQAPRAEGDAHVLAGGGLRLNVHERLACRCHGAGEQADQQRAG